MLIWGFNPKRQTDNPCQKHRLYGIFNTHIIGVTIQKRKIYHQACSKQIKGGARHECEYQGIFTSAYTHVHHYSEAPQHTQYMFYTSEHETSYWRRIAMS